MATRKIRMSSKGQIVLPRELREKRGWRDGTVLEVVDTVRGVLVRGAAAEPHVGVDALVGCIPYRGPKHTVAEMERALVQEAARQRKSEKNASTSQPTTRARF